MIRDLFPSYIEHLTSTVTDQHIAEHLAECEDCRKVLDCMREPDAEPQNIEEQKEIDFLKKARKRNRKAVLLSVLAAVAVMVLILLVQAFVIGTHVSGEYVTCDVDVDGKELTVSGAITDKARGISKVTFAEEDGVVTVSFRSVQKSIWHGGDFEETFMADKEITEVRLDERIAWSKGEAIDAMTSAVYESAHPYIGDMSKNGQTIGALNMVSALGNFTNELKTVEEPYGWTMVLADSVTDRQQDAQEDAMRSYAYVLLAVIDNLGYVSYEYNVDGTNCELVVTEEEATAFAGADIKDVGKDVVSLQYLMDQLSGIR